MRHPRLDSTAVLRKAAWAGLFVAIGVAGAWGVHAQTEDPPVPADHPYVAPELPDRPVRDEIMAATDCTGLAIRADLYDQIPDLTEPYATYQTLVDERLAELGCPEAVTPGG